MALETEGKVLAIQGLNYLRLAADQWAHADGIQNTPALLYRSIPPLEPLVL